MKSRILLLFAAFTMSIAASAQVKVGGLNPTPNADAILELESTSKGVILPRVALTGTANFAPLSAHVQGMTVYNTATAGDVTPGIYVNDGPKWVSLGGAATNSAILVNSVNPTYNGENVIIDLNTGAHNFTLPNPANYNNRIIFYRNASVEGGTGGTATFITYVPANNPTILGNRGAAFYSDGTQWRLVAGL